MKILVAEDDTGTGRLLSYLLQRRGHDVEWHWDGDRALRSLERCLPDLVIVDLQLPNVNGLEILSRLREGPESRDVPAIMLTGTTDPAVVERCKALGVLEFIVKPFKPALLRERVQRIERMLA